MDRVDYSPIVIKDILNLHQAEELDIDPWYQRRPVWTVAQKAYLINTLFVGMPIPSIYIRHYLSIEQEKSIKEVVDGQQRLRSIIEYCENHFKARHPEHKKPVLYSELSTQQKTEFLMRPISVGYLIGADDADVIEIFGRLNWASKKLNDQEKRNAKYGGEFKQFALTHGTRRVNFWRDYGIFTANDIARMAEVQFISDITLNIIDGLSDFSQKKLNDLYDRYDLEFPQYEELSSKLNKVFDCVSNLLPDQVRASEISRQPVFFSLCYVLAGMVKTPSKKKLQEIGAKIDGVILADKEGQKLSAREKKFAEACKSSTQRIRSRKTRDDFIRSLF